MELLNHSKKKGSSLNRGVKVEVTDQVKRSEINKEEPKKKSENSRFSIPANIRVDNNVRNAISALSVLGYGNSQLEVVELLINHHVEKLDKEEYKRFVALTDIYLDRDMQKQKKK